MTKKMDKDMKYLQARINILDSTEREDLMVRESMYGITANFMRENGAKALDMVLVHGLGQTTPAM